MFLNQWSGPRRYFICPAPGFANGQNWSFGRIEVQYANCPCKCQQQSSHCWHCCAEPLLAEGKSWSGPVWARIGARVRPSAEAAHKKPEDFVHLLCITKEKLSAGVYSNTEPSSLKTNGHLQGEPFNSTVGLVHLKNYKYGQLYT